jgi:hypothetical protein
MPISDRDYMKGSHPPSCTCVDCVNRRLGIVTKKPQKKSSFKNRSSYSKQYKSKSVNMGRIGNSIRNKLKRLLVIAALVAVATIVVVTVCRFITSELAISSFIIYLVVGLILVIWCLSSVSKHRLSFSRTFMVILIAGIFSLVSYVYLDVRSFQDVRDSVEKALSTKTEQFRSNVDLAIKRTELKFTEASSSVGEKVKEQTSELVNTSTVYVHGGILIGADGHRITLRNNPDAKNPSWAELKTFLLKDNTDSIKYDFDKFVCADFAERVHNNAEAAGIRAAFVSIWLGPCSYFPTSGGHALDAFETTDRGLVYIDCTGFLSGVNADKIVDVKVGKDYIPQSIFPEPGWSDTWDDMGKVEEIETIQW